jgi:membrane-bound lytic murein transglycosylase F
MTKLRRPVAATLLAGLVVAAGAAPAADLAAVQKRGTLRVLAVVMDPDEFITSQPGRGLEREMLESFANLHRVRLEVVDVAGWDRLVPMLLEGRGDLVAGRFTVTEARRQKVDFTAEVFPTRAVVVTRRPRAAVASVDALRREKVGTVKGTSLAEAVAALGLPPDAVDDGVPAGTLPQALKTGRVTAVVMGVENAMAEKRRDPDLQIGAFVGPPGSLAWAVRREDATLRAALDEYIAGVRRTPTWSRLVVKYFGGDAPEILKGAQGR